MKKVKKTRLFQKLLAWCLCTTFMFNMIYSSVIPVRAEEQQPESSGCGDEVELAGMHSSYVGENYRIDFQVSDSWNGGYQADVIITNTGNQKIEDWRVAFSSDSSIINIWNATIIDNISGYDMIKNVGWNQDIDVGSSVNFGFLSNQTFQACPKQIFLFGDISEVNSGDYTITYSVEQVWDSGYNGLITIANNGTTIIEDWNLEFIFENQIRDIWDAVILEQNNHSYRIGNATYNQNIEIGESISFGFTVDSVSYEITPERFVLTDVIDGIDHNQDSDGDGLTDKLELIIETNPYEADSDRDDIQDAYEYLILLTDPMSVDTDGNGIWDGEEDFDEDKLNNKLEFQYGTDPFLTDTDRDGLPDYDEIFQYGTNPIMKDSDEDRLEDDDELLFGFDPWNPDSNNNMIIDGDEKIDQQKTMVFAESELPAVEKVTVDISISGNVEKVLEIENTYKKDMLSSDVEGLVSIPVNITTEQEFDQAVITFYYDETKLGEIPEENLAVMWYDEANNWYQILDEDSIIDTEKNTVSYTTTHFSTYMLVDKEEWYQAWKKDMDYRNSKDGEATAYDIAFVVDVSGSMRGKSIENAKSAISGFVDTVSFRDRVCLITFNSSASVVSPFSSDNMLLRMSIRSLSASGGTNVDKGLQAGIKEFNSLDSENQKIMILICDGDVNYNEITISAAASMGIKIYTVNVGSGSASGYLKRIAQATGGEYYFCRSSSEIETMFGDIQGDTVGNIDTTDTDGDGLFDVYETAGFRLINGRIIKSDPNRKDTDGDGLMDYEETGIVYNMSYPDAQFSYRYIGNGETIQVPYIIAYSDPQKKDTDDDGIQDNIDLFPWSKPCSQEDGANAHKHLLLGEDGFYTCQDCGVRIKSPALQDVEVLSEEDLATVMACNVMFAYYTELVYEVYGTVDYLSLNQKLLVNQIAKIRQSSKYMDCYEYSSGDGVCICDTFVVDSNAICTVDVSKMNGFDLNMYNGLIPNAVSLLAGKINPLAGLLVTAIGTEAIRDADQQLTPMEFANYVMATAGCLGIEGKVGKIISDVGLEVSAASLLDTFLNSDITMDDYEVTIYLHRGGTGRSVKQSHGLFVVSGEGIVKWHQYAEYGYETWEERLGK